MPPGAPDSHPPPPDLDVPAARAAARSYGSAVARGVAEEVAWRGACELFALHHPAWPLPLSEREAARTVGGLIAAERARAAHRREWLPPPALLRRLAAPALPGAGPPFRRLMPLPGAAWPIPARLPLLRLSPPEARPC